MLIGQKIFMKFGTQMGLEKVGILVVFGIEIFLLIFYQLFFVLVFLIYLSLGAITDAYFSPTKLFRKFSLKMIFNQKSND